MTKNVIQESTTLQVIDDEAEDVLTLSDLRELKKLAELSRITRYVVTFLMGVVAAIGLPEIVHAVHKATN